MTKTISDQIFMSRANQLAYLAGRQAAPNPLVGAVLVYHNKIIGEGFHMQAGGAHAEVLALQSVSNVNQRFISEATMYVSLEPCAHHGKTPPCAVALVNAKVKRVVIGSYDPSEKVNGKGTDILEKAGVELTVGLSKKTEFLPHIFFETAENFGRPFTLLKFAQSKDGFIARPNEAVWLTNAWSKRLVHSWRATFGAILVGTNTALEDDPKLSTRFGFGDNPLRIIPDFGERLPADLALFAIQSPIWILCSQLPRVPVDLPHVKYQLLEKNDWITSLNSLLLSSNINSLIIEGGAKILNAYIAANSWDEARVFKTNRILHAGIAAPQLAEEALRQSQSLLSDTLHIYRPNNN